MMAFIVLEDLFGTMECIIFPNTFKNYNSLIHEESFVVLEGTLNVKEEEQPKVLVNTISPLLKISDRDLTKVGIQKGNKLYIKIKSKESWFLIERAKPIFKRHSGNTPIIIYIEEGDKGFQADKDLWVNLSKELIDKLSILFGSENIKVT